MVKGDIYLVALKPRSGSEQMGVRPAVLISHDRFNERAAWRSVTVVPISSSDRWLVDGPTTVIFDKDESGLNKRCAAVAHQITTLDKSKCMGLIGKCSPKRLAEIERALLNYLDIE